MVTHSPYMLSKRLGKYLLDHNLKVAVAESCTGGGLAYAITAVAGSSHWLDRGVVTYSNKAKIELLDVSPDTIYNYGEVSEQTAQEMASGVLANSHADVGISITGVAGPTGGTVEKPVGTVCFGLAFRDGVVESRRKVFDSGRKNVRDCSIYFALGWLIQVIENRNF